MNLQENLKKYAKLALVKGVNIQKGQELLLNAPIDARELVAHVVEEAYKMGSGRVHVFYNDENLSPILFDNASDEVIESFPMWRKEAYMSLAESGAALMSIGGQNPELLKNCDPKKVAKSAMISGKVMRPFSEYVGTGKIQWNIITYPNTAWAKKVFPNESCAEKAVEKLWDYIFKCTRVDQDDPIKAWDEHINRLFVKRNFLNEKKFVKLHYKAPGTDLMVGLPEGHIWVAGPKDTEYGVSFIPNIPTEEVFTMNTKTDVNGTLRSTMPLNYSGNLITNFHFTFKDGKVVDFGADEGYEQLKNLLDTDEGAKFLGEVALVPFDSPISNLNTIFYNTLYDENASCHFALGRAYKYTLEGGTKMNDDEFVAAGGNNSNTHVDFMVGSKELSIDGITSDGEVVPIFVNGDWAF